MAIFIVIVMVGIVLGYLRARRRHGRAVTVAKAGVARPVSWERGRRDPWDNRGRLR